MSELRTTYDAGFYMSQIHGSVRSANVVVPRIRELFPQARSVVDVGCGSGSWLSVFERLGMDEIFGIDGGAAEADLLLISPSQFKTVDLERPIELGRRFDLCTTLEVAEHLTPGRASGFVRDLCGLSDVVVFSAAIPGQGGTNHINEAWPSFWRRLFADCGYGCYDLLRPGLWYEPRIEWWYAQNILLFVNRQRNDLITELERKRDGRIPVDLVHPGIFKQYRDYVEDLKDELILLRNHVQTVEAERDQMSAERSADNDMISLLRQELDGSRAEVADLTLRLEEAEQALETSRGTLQALETSTSWRFTAAGRSFLERRPTLRTAARRLLGRP